jgi:IclR family KDG regulon transcriptional repressor
MMMKPEFIPDDAADSDTDTAGQLSSVNNAMRLIKIFSDEHYEIGLSELSRRLQLPKSSVHRLATTLVESHMLMHHAETGKYRLGLLMFELASLMARKRHVADDMSPASGLKIPALEMTSTAAAVEFNA